MPREEPSWWYAARPDARIGLLRPIARIWAAVAGRRMSRPPRYRSLLPVVCIGNFTAGGTGKTPLSLTIAERLIARGLSPAFLTRGYGAERKAPGWVDPATDTAREAGDEPLLLARVAPVLISPDRAAGARMVEARRPAVDVIVMDDGLQNSALAKDFRIALVDGRRGVGNGEVMPAGPLRASLEIQLGHVDAIVINQPPAAGDAASERSTSLVARLRAQYDGPILSARVTPAGDVQALRSGPLIAFAGIANPQRFYELLATLAVAVVETRSFGDHHAFTEAEARALLARADALGAGLVTTEKDFVRLRGAAGALGELAARSRVLPIRLAFGGHDGERLDALLDAVATRGRQPVSGAGDGP